MRRAEPREIAVFTAIGLAHILVVALLVTALVRSGVLPNPTAITVINVDSPEPLTPLPPSRPLAVPVDVNAPALEVADDPPPIPAPSGYDPFGGAAVRGAPPSIASMLPSAATASPSALSTSGNAEDLAWMEALKQRLRNLQKSLGTKLVPAVFEVLARPAGGFTEIRVRSKSGSEEADQQILEAIMARQALVPPGKVAAASWIALPEISVDAAPSQTAQRSENTKPTVSPKT